MKKILKTKLVSETKIKSNINCQLKFVKKKRIIGLEYPV